jgi:tetratricopeptide (TPR) repeat protein
MVIITLSSLLIRKKIVFGFAIFLTHSFIVANNQDNTAQTEQGPHQGTENKAECVEGFSDHAMERALLAACGRLYESSDDLVGAELCYLKGVNKYNDFDCTHLLAGLYLVQDKKEQAKKYYHKLLIHPDIKKFKNLQDGLAYAKLMSRIGAIFLDESADENENKDINEHLAAMFLDEAIKYNDPFTLFFLAREIYSMDEHPEQAIDYLERCLISLNYDGSCSDQTLHDEATVLLIELYEKINNKKRTEELRKPAENQ